MKIGTVLTIKGITQKGKNRVNEHGNQWIVCQVRPIGILLKSVKTDYWKWHFQENSDFSIVDSASLAESLK